MPGRAGEHKNRASVAVSLGDDAGMTGAVLGQLAAAFRGESGIPELWRSRLAMRKRMNTLAWGLRPGNWVISRSEVVPQGVWITGDPAPMAKHHAHG